MGETSRGEKTGEEHRGGKLPEEKGARTGFLVFRSI